MTRFMQELNGLLGPYWENSAKEELKEIESVIAAGKITFDECGIARNCAGRVLMSDMIEKVAVVSDKINVEATMKAREDEDHKAVSEYREKMKSYVLTDEDIYEMQSAFGANTTVVDILSGQKINL